MILKCLSVRQPWAWLIVFGGKDIENRTWNTSHRGQLLIHASKGMTAQEYEDARAFAGTYIPPAAELERGGIVGVTSITGVRAPRCARCSEPNPWHIPDQYGFELGRRAPLPFREYRGAQGMFSVTLTTSEERIARELACFA